MEEILLTIQSHIEFAPFIIFGLLLLAGFCLPVSEDGMLFISGLLAASNPDHAVSLFIGVYLGAYFSDIIAYWLGRLAGPALWKIKLVEKTVPMSKIMKMHHYYEHYGIITLILGRFIPFGVRNALFLTAGLSRMHFIKFALSDLLACTISTAVFFPLYFYVGRPVIEYVKKGNVVIFIVAITVISLLYLRSRRNKTNGKD